MRSVVVRAASSARQSVSALGYWVGGALPRRRPRALVVRYGWHPGSVAEWHPAHAPHLLVSGRTGSGKSTALRSLLAGLPRLAVPWRVVVLDPKGGLDWSDLAHVAHIATTPADIAAACAWLGVILDDHAAVISGTGARSWSEYLARTDKLLPVFPTVVVVDEAVAVFAGLNLPKADAAVVVHNLARVVQQGRALGALTLLSVLRPDASALGPHGGLLREQLGARLALGPLSDDGRRMLGADVDGRVRGGRGFGVAVGTTMATEHRPRPVRVARLDDDQVVEQLDAMTHRWLTGPPLSDPTPVDP